MARPNVTFRINDQSLVGPRAESPNFKMFGGMLAVGHQLNALATAEELTAGLMFIPNIANLYSRLTSMVTTFAGGATYLAGVTLYSAGSCASSIINGSYAGQAFEAGQFYAYPFGPEGISGIGLTGGRTGFREQFWSLNNFLNYGAPVYVGLEGGGVSGFVALCDDAIFDVAFQGISSEAAVNGVVRIIEEKKANDLPVFGILNWPSSTATISDATSFTAYPGYTFDDFHYGIVYGEKTHFGSDAETLITTILAPDVAGCIARTDRDYFPWFSPAGQKRGKILNLVKLTRNLRAAEQDVLFDAGVNPVVTFPGEGTFLFGDKTTKADTSTLSRINVARLFINLKKTLGSIARRTLFEQNNEATRSNFIALATQVLERVRAQDGISNFKVICDETNNPPSVVEANQFFAEVLVQPITSINFITITLTNVDLEDTIA